MSRDNLSIVLNSRPEAAIEPGETFHQKTTPIPTADDLKDGQILVENLYLSLDPAMRGWLRDVRSYLPPVQIGAVMRGSTASRVLASKSSKASEGDIISASGGWTEHAILNEAQFESTDRFPGLREPQDMLSYLGMTGITAWVGMAHIAKPKAGELVVVSGAAGATGSVAGQIAKLNGARVIGTAGSDEKCKWLVDDLGFDVALNYKDSDFKTKFFEATKDFIDVYYDNVGGETLDLALHQAKKNARFIECGLISQYNDAKPTGPRNFARIVAMRITMTGFIVLDHEDKYPQARKELSQWVADGKMKKSETILRGGLKVAEQGLIDLYKGINQGKLIVEIKNPNESPAKL